MAHSFVFETETDDNHVFRCATCGMAVEFNKPGIGTPNADLSGPEPLPPVDVEAYVTPCTGVQE